jgi:hypothetical protein
MEKTTVILLICCGYFIVVILAGILVMARNKKLPISLLPEGSLICLLQ